MEESSSGKLVATVSAPKNTDQITDASPAGAAATQSTTPARTVTPSRPPPAAPTALPKPVTATAPTPVLSPEDQAKVRADAASTTSPSVRVLLTEARVAFSQKDYTTAGSKYEAVLATEPSNIVALTNLGIIRYQQNRLDDAEKYLRQATAAAPNDSNTRSLLGVVYYRKGAIEDAYAELNRAVAIDPHNAEAHNYLGIVLFEKGWGASGELEIRRAIEINPQYPDAHLNLAILYAKQRNPKVELAKYHYHKALDLGAKPDPQLEALMNKLSQQPAVATDDKTAPAPAQ
jgi:tetratricopeptide (TPR) repeat protein